jgi:hypothetical protein
MPCAGIDEAFRFIQAAFVAKLVGYTTSTVFCAGRRRDFIWLFGSVTYSAAWPVGAREQQLAVPVVGFVNPGS